MAKQPINKPKAPVGYMFDGLLDKVSKDKDGVTYIVLKTTAAVKDDILDLYGQPIECAVKKRKAKKSINANNYCWELCAQIAASVGLGSIDVYKDAVRHRGVYKDYDVPPEEIENINNIWKDFGIGWFTEKVDRAPEDKVTLRCYFGTSSYNTAQMSSIINYLTEEADNLGLTTLSKENKDELIKTWKMS